jgi:hypothetical protein
VASQPGFTLQGHWPTVVTILCIPNPITTSRAFGPPVQRGATRSSLFRTSAWNIERLLASYTQLSVVDLVLSPWYRHCGGWRQVAGGYGNQIFASTQYGWVALGKCATGYASAVVNRLSIQFLFRMTSFYPAVVSIVHLSIGHWQCQCHTSVSPFSTMPPCRASEPVLFYVVSRYQTHVGAWQESIVIANIRIASRVGVRRTSSRSCRVYKTLLANHSPDPKLGSTQGDHVNL